MCGLMVIGIYRWTRKSQNLPRESKCWQLLLRYAQISRSQKWRGNGFQTEISAPQRRRLRLSSQFSSGTSFHRSFWYYIPASSTRLGVRFKEKVHIASWLDEHRKTLWHWKQLYSALHEKKYFRRLASMGTLWRHQNQRWPGLTGSLYFSRLIHYSISYIIYTTVYTVLYKI